MAEQLLAKVGKERYRKHGHHHDASKKRANERHGVIAACLVAKAVPTEQGHHTDTQLKASVNERCKSDDTENGGVVHVYFAILCLIYTISITSTSKK